MKRLQTGWRPRIPKGIRRLEYDGRVPKGMFGIAVSRYHPDITGGLLAGCVQRWLRSGVDPRAIRVAVVPGSFEIPPAARLLARRCRAVAALGCIIKGGTRHDEVLAGEVARGIGRISSDTGVPVSFGVLTTQNLAQARARSRPGPMNKGAEAAAAALEMARLREKLR